MVSSFPRALARFVAEGSARLVPDLRAAEALAWVMAEPGGAVASMVMSATGSAVEVEATRDAQRLLDAAVARALAAGAIRALAWEAVGRVPEGSAMTVVAASAPTRREAKAALDALHDGLRGVTVRRDVR